MSEHVDAEITSRKTRMDAVRATVRFFHPYRYSLLLAQVLFVIKHSPIWILPILTADLINVVSQPERYAASRIVLNAFILLALIVQNVPMHLLYVRQISQAARAVEANLRQQLIRRLQQLSFGFLDRRPSGLLQSKLMRDVEAVHGLTQMGLTLITSSVTSLAVAICVTAAKQPALLAFYAIGGPVAVALTHYFQHRINDRNRSFREHTESLSARILDMIHMLPLTRAHGLESVEVTDVSGRLNLLRDQGLRLDVTNALFGAMWWCSSQLMQAACLLLTVWMAWNKTIPPGDVVLFTSLFAMMVNAIGQVVDAFPALSKGLESARSIRELLDATEVESYDGKPPVNQVRGTFDFDRVTFTYPETGRPALRDFSLHVEAGETLAFVGPSGSGKSTLMSLIIGLRHPQSGRILLDGADMTALDLRSYRRHLAVVPQQTILFNGTVRDNITYGLPDVNEEFLRDVLAQSQVEEFLTGLAKGLETPLGEHGVLLSGGQRQRIAIARALLRNPRIIILDEATSALDSVSERHVQEAIRHLVAGRTTFIVAHRLSTIRHANRIVVLREGQLMEVGTHDDLLARRGEYARLHTSSLS